MLENIELRLYARKHQVSLWRVAKELGISEPTLYIRLRGELDAEETARFTRAVDTLAKDGKKV